MRRTIQFCSQRNQVFYWRRRIPNSAGFVDFSLGTRDWHIAQQLSSLLALESERAFVVLREGKMTEEQVQAFLKQCFLKHQSKLRSLTVLALDSGHDIRDEISANLVAAHAHLALANGGLNGQAEPTGDAVFDRNATKMADRIADMMWSDGGTARLRREIADFLGEQPTSVDVAVARTAKLNAMAAAELAAADELSSRSGTSQVERSRQLAALLAISAEPTPQAPVARAAHSPTHAGSSSAPSMPAAQTGTLDFALEMVERWVETGTHSAEFGKVKLRVIEEFVDCTGCVTLQEIRQADIWKWMRVMERLPRNHGKSPDDADLTLTQRAERASMSGQNRLQTIGQKTIKKNLTILGNLLGAARKAGIEGLAELSTSIQDGAVTGAGRTDRPAFEVQDLLDLFKGPVWTGCRSQARRNEAGNLIIQDGLYWCPLISAHTGLRREEVAGMRVDDVELQAAVQVFVIRENCNRGLKTIASARTIPVPPAILRLGFAKYVAERQRMKDADLFPELRSSTAFGEKLDYNFSKALDLALGNRRVLNGRSKSFHSLRHFVATELGRHQDIKDKTVEDLLGHENVGTTNRIYKDATPVEVMLAAIERLPDLAASAREALRHARIGAPRSRNKTRSAA